MTDNACGDQERPNPALDPFDAWKAMFDDAAAAGFPLNLFGRQRTPSAGPQQACDNPETLRHDPQSAARVLARLQELQEEYPTDQENTMPPALYYERLILAQLVAPGSALCHCQALRLFGLTALSTPLHIAWKAVKELLNQQS